MIQSCGIVPVRFLDDGHEYLLLRNFSHWDFPKGKREDGETKISCAMRELAEEANLYNPQFSWGTEVSYQTEPYSSPKKVAIYFLALIFPDEEVKLKPNPETGIIEHQEFKWFRFDQASQILKPRILKALEFAEKLVNEDGK